MSDEDPTAIRSVAVTAADVVAALETRRRGGPRVVLRVTPPFSARMRARLHVERGEDDERAIHLPPADLVADPPPVPDAADETAVERWRDAVRSRIVDHVTIDTTAGAHEVGVKTLG